MRIAECGMHNDDVGISSSPPTANSCRVGVMSQRDCAPRSFFKSAILLGLCTQLFLFTPAVAHAQRIDCTIESISLGFGVENVYKPGFWCPLKITLKSRSGGFQGALVVSTNDSDGQEVRFVLPNIAVEKADANAAAVTKTIYHYIKCGSTTGTINVRLLDGRERQVDEQRLELVNANQTTQFLMPGQSLVLTIGTVAGLSELNRDDAVSPENQKIVSLLNIDDLPTQWFAYGPADALVIGTRDQNFFNRLDPLRASALLTWVRQGGRLVVSVADNWQVVDKSFIGPTLPAKLTGVGKVRVPDALENFAGGKTRLDNTGQGLSAATLSEVKGKVQIGQGDKPLIVAGAYGLGMVTLLGFDVDTPPFSIWADRKEFWIRFFEFPRAGTQDPGTRINQRQLAFRGVSDMSSRLQTQLENFPEVTVVPFGWVALLIFGYILLIGPIDYLFLKKVVGRLELTWITFPTWVILVSVAAYFGANYLKGSDLRINRIDIVDIDPASSTLRGSSFMALFSPRIARYTLTMTPKLANGGSWSQLGLGNDQVERLSSWNGVPEDATRGMYSRGNVGLFGGRAYGYPVGGEPTSLDGVPIQVWSVKSFAYRWLAKAGPSLEADIKIVDESLTGTVTNRMDRPLTNLVLAWTDRVYEVPRLDAGASIDLGATKSRTLTGYLGDNRIVGDDEPANVTYVQRNQSGEMDPDSIVRGLLFSSKTPKSARKLPSSYLRELDMSDRIDLGKVIVFAKVDGDGGQFWYDALPEQAQTPPAVPGVMRTHTYVRILIDPKKETP